MDTKTTIIKVRRGINGFKYSACDENGILSANIEKLLKALVKKSKGGTSALLRVHLDNLKTTL